MGQYLISFREALEAALIIGILLAYFRRTGRPEMAGSIWTGASLAILASAFIAVSVFVLFGGLAGASAELFEGVAGLVAAAVLTGMILWMATRGRQIERHVGEKAERSVKGRGAFGLLGVAFVVVFREGFEAVLFLVPFAAEDPLGTLAGAGLGVFSALVISVLIFATGLRIDLSRFFYLTSMLLILVAGGLIGYSVHELIEYMEHTGTDPGWFGAVIYDLGLPDDHPLHHKGAIGSVFAVMFGYSAKMEAGRLLLQGTYLLVFVPLAYMVHRRPGTLTSPPGIRRSTVRPPARAPTRLT